MPAPFRPGMIVKKKHYTDIEKQFLFLLWTSFIICLLFFSFVSQKYKVSDECVPISNETCVKRITSDIPAYDYKGHMITYFLITFLVFNMVMSFIAGEDYQLTINTQEEYDKEFPIKMKGNDRERDTRMMEKLMEIQETLKSRGAKK